VRSKPEAAHRYGSFKKKKKMIPGIVVALDSVQKPANKKLSWFVTADYDNINDRVGSSSGSDYANDDGNSDSSIDRLRRTRK
jgi:hypothetical protein